MKSDRLGFDLAIFHFALVSHHDNRYVLANPGDISVPCLYALVRDSRCDVEHDDGAVTADVVTIAQAAILLLAGSIPDIEANAAYRVAHILD
eukprot:SAG31_NODE_3044_length_4751_cov_29.695615_2_plen_92_part_00